MKIGIVVDGDAEALALRRLVGKLQIPSCCLENPLYADLQPKATPHQIARSAADKVELLIGRGVDRVVLLLDREDQETCPGDRAVELESAFRDLGYEQVQVAIKDRCYENWLIADLSALRALPARFRVSRGFEGRVSPDKADHVADPASLLTSVSQRHGYHKRRDAVQIATKQDPLLIARNSRSFRRFLRLLTHPAYRTQSRFP